MSSKKKTHAFTRFDFIILGLILVVALAFRLYKINTPLADWHSWRQADTAAVARNFERDGFDLLTPKYDDLSAAQTGSLNPEGIRLVEFPLYSALFAALHKYLPVMPLEQYGRAVSIFFSLISISIVYYLTRKEVDQISASAAALVFSVFPFFVYYSRVVLPEPMAVSLVMMALWLLYMYFNTNSVLKSRIFFVLSMIAAGIAVLVKPTAIFYFLALGFLFIRKHKITIIKRPEVYLYFIVALIPFVLWRYRISLSDVGAPPALWLLTTVNTFEGPREIFMRPAFFRWIFHERILLLIFGGWAGFSLVLGALRRYKNKLLVYGVGFSALIYIFTFQGGNVQHDYYQAITFPALAMFSGLGVGLLYHNSKAFINKFFVSLAVIAIFGFSFMMSFEQVKGFYGYSEELIDTSQVLRTLTPPDALIATDTLGDTTLLYNADRRGFPVKSGTLPELQEQGIEYFVTNNAETAQKVIDEFGNEYEVIFKNDNVHIFQL